MLSISMLSRVFDQEGSEHGQILISLFQELLKRILKNSKDIQDYLLVFYLFSTTQWPSNRPWFFIKDPPRFHHPLENCPVREITLEFDLPQNRRFVFAAFQCFVEIAIQFSWNQKNSIFSTIFYYFNDSSVPFFIRKELQFHRRKVYQSIISA